VLRRVVAQVVLTDVRLTVLRTLRRLNLISWSTSALLGGEKTHPYYSFGLASACKEAKALGLKRISALEFGVAGGKGLMALARAAQHCRKEFGIQVEVLGFDSGLGMPYDQGFQDAPYLWSKGDFRMDLDALREALPKSTNVILGDVSDSVKLYLSSSEKVNDTEVQDGNPSPSIVTDKPNSTPTMLKIDEIFDATAPIAFVAFDLDYYSSTKSALRIFDGASCLPRVWTYFDDLDYISKETGEWLAIDEFNSEHKSLYISEVGLSLPSWVNWSNRMRVVHTYGHPLYSKPLYSDQQLPLR
jgi:hypothetical protein